METDHTNLFYDYKDFSTKADLSLRDLGGAFTIEKLTNALEQQSIFTNFEEIYESIGKVKKRGLSNDLASVGGGKGGADISQVEEMIDGKVERMYERLRNDNWVIWKESLKLAEKQFSEDGI